MKMLKLGYFVLGAHSSAEANLRYAYYRTVERMSYVIEFYVFMGRHLTILVVLSLELYLYILPKAP